MDLMDAARYVAMDAQRFDPMRRIKKCHFVQNTRKGMMGQVLRKSLHLGTQRDDAVGGIWEDHELVFVPIAAHSPTETFTYTDSESGASNSSSSSASSYTTASLSSSISERTINTSQPCSHQAEVYDRDDLVITRTIIRPAPEFPITSLFTRSSSPTPSRPTSPFLRPFSPILNALNCISASAFAQELDEGKAKEPEQSARKPVLQVIVTQTREQYEHDMAFKEAVQEIYPESSGRPRH
ncbi:hypothetical protein SCLCIDRAFT_673024 [Scleroderma citrinum Foug A]|uniref:Uncharacterized protein n=1 Tax=Scleroderma citrinum Foug A TaxID=1036808 RepID=A0A0C3E631_9AGAM|nr:hypothetical protein SCLCIDRAFT_673024 [Scleroderma citrinum Foug A]